MKRERAVLLEAFEYGKEQEKFVRLRTHTKMLARRTRYFSEARKQIKHTRRPAFLRREKKTTWNDSRERCRTVWFSLPRLPCAVRDTRLAFATEMLTQGDQIHLHAPASRKPLFLLKEKCGYLERRTTPWPPGHSRPVHQVSGAVHRTARPLICNGHQGLF